MSVQSNESNKSDESNNESNDYKESNKSIKCVNILEYIFNENDNKKDKKDKTIKLLDVDKDCISNSLILYFKDENDVYSHLLNAYDFGRYTTHDIIVNKCDNEYGDIKSTLILCNYKYKYIELYINIETNWSAILQKIPKGDL